MPILSSDCNLHLGIVRKGSLPNQRVSINLKNGGVAVVASRSRGKSLVITLDTKLVTSSWLVLSYAQTSSTVPTSSRLGKKRTKILFLY